MLLLPIELKREGRKGTEGRRKEAGLVFGSGGRAHGSLVEGLASLTTANPKRKADQLWIDRGLRILGFCRSRKSEGMDDGGMAGCSGVWRLSDLDHKIDYGAKRVMSRFQKVLIQAL